MKEKGYEAMWILTEIDLFASDPGLKCYICRPPGNSPELFNIYSCPNKYFHKAVDYHVRYTHSLHKFYPKNLVLQLQRKEHKLAFGYLIQLTMLLHQENG